MNTFEKRPPFWATKTVPFVDNLVGHDLNSSFIKLS